VRVLPDWAAPETEVFLVHRFGHERIQRVRAVADAAVGQVGALLAPPAPRRSAGEHQRGAVDV
jgi:hypothetical protein